MELISCTNPVWGDADHTSILCVADFGNGPMPFNCMASDPEQHGKNLWTVLNAGKYGPIAAFVPLAAPKPKTPTMTVPLGGTRGPNVIR